MQVPETSVQKRDDDHGADDEGLVYRARVASLWHPEELKPHSAAETFFVGLACG